MYSDREPGLRFWCDRVPGLRFWYILTGYRTVDSLLQRMFEADLDPEDFGGEDDPEESSNFNFSNPVFSSI